MKAIEVHKRTARTNEPCEDNVGEMSPSDLRDTCMDLHNQRIVKITAKDIDKEVRSLAYWHSKKTLYRDFRRDYMTKYTPDTQDIST